MLLDNRRSSRIMIPRAATTLWGCEMRCDGAALRLLAIYGTLVAAAAAWPAAARAQDDQRTRLPNTGITLGEVAIEGGRLSIVGRTPAPRQSVTVDGQFA